jgi:hypothetical protein
MAVKASYSHLTAAEKAHWNEYTNLRDISDWDGFDSKQQERKEDSRKWLVEQRKKIWRLAQPKSKGGDGQGWKVANRRERHTFLKDEHLNSGAPKHRVRLPAPAVCTDTERVYIEEREVYLVFGSTTPEQKARKVANLTWLVDRRKRLYRLIKEHPTDARRRRYDVLCIATHTGQAYKDWDKTHNKWGVPNKPKPSGPDPHSRAGIVAWCNKYVGVKENPPGSNRGEPHPNDWQRRVFGGTGVPWCACFSVCSAWDAGIKGSGTASVQLNVNLARKGQGIYRGYTTDPKRVRPGDHCAVISTSTHTEVVVDGPYDCIGGNTGPSSISNGGMVARTHRRGQIVGWMLIREP